MTKTKRFLMTLAALFAMTAGAWAAEPTVYTSEVAITDLNEGDILCVGATINTNNAGTAMFAANRWKYVGEIKTSNGYFNKKPYTVLEDASFAWSDGYVTPVTESGTDGNAWVVTSVSTSNGWTDVYVGGTNYSDPNAPIALTADEAKKVWTLAQMPAGNVVFQVEYEPWTVTVQTPANGTVEATTGGEVKELTASDVTAWDGDTTPLSAADLPGFAEVMTTEQALVWNGAPASGISYLIYAFEGGETKRIMFYNGSTSASQSAKERNGIYRDLNRSTPDRWFYTAASGVTANSDGTYSVVAGKSITLKATPDEGYRLAGWYKVDGSDVTELTDGVDAEAGTLTLTPEGDITVRAEFVEQTYTVTLTDVTYQTNANVTATVASQPATITEAGTIEGVKAGQTVILKANTGYKFRKVEAKEGAGSTLQSISLSTPSAIVHTIYYLPGETWRQAIANRPTENTKWEVWGEPNKVWYDELKVYIGSNLVNPDDVISSSEQYKLDW